MESNNNTLLTILLSACIGALLGVLFAPDKGENIRGEISKKSKETSRDITKKSKDYASKAKDELEDYIDYMRGKYEKAKKRADDVIDKGEDIAKEQKRKLD